MKVASFLDGDARVLLHRMFFPPVQDLFCQDSRTKTVLFPSLFFRSPCSVAFPSSPSFIPLQGAVSSSQSPLVLINFGGFV